MDTYKFGKLPPKNDDRTLRFGKYATHVDLPPESFNVLDRVYKNLDEHDPKKLFPMDWNHIYGTCTIAAMAHAETVFRGLTRCEMIMEADKVKDIYFNLSGGTDTGLNMLDVLKYWRNSEVSVDKLIAFAKIDHNNLVHIKQAINLFGGVYIGFKCQENCVEDFRAGKTWTPGPLTNEGHAVFVVAYDEDGVTVLTWGNTQKGKWDWFEKCVDEAYVLLPDEAKDIEFAGFDLKQLQEDLAKITN